MRFRAITRRPFHLYEWNAELAAAVWRDVAHLEVAVRNAFDRCLDQHLDGDHWIRRDRVLFDRTRGKTGNADTRSRRDVEVARRRAGPDAPPGKVVAELSFGFWRYLTSASYEKRLWLPALRHALPDGTDRAREVERPMSDLHQLRNRVAHHEPLLRTPVGKRHKQVLALAELVLPELAEHIRRSSRVPEVLGRDPRSTT